MADELEKLLKEIVQTTKTARKENAPRSKFIEAIMTLLLSRPLRTAEIAQALNKDSKYVSSYLSYWRVRGYFEYENGLWYLTPKGEEYAKLVVSRIMDKKFNEYLMIARQILNEKNKETIKNKETLEKYLDSRKSLSFIVDLTDQKDNKLQDPYLCVKQIIPSLHLTQDEEELLLTFFEHVIQWKSTYMYADQLLEKTHSDYQWLMKTLRYLQAKQLLYIYNDPKLGVRIGLTKQAKQIFSVCLE